MIGLAIAAAAATVSIPFAPPTTPLRYEMTQTREGRQGTVHFTVGRTVRFVRADDRGWRLEMMLTDYKTDASGNSQAVVEAGVGALKGITFAYSLSETGAVTGVIDGDRALAAMEASYQSVLRAVEADPRSSPDRLAGVRMIVAAVAKQPREAQLQHLQDEARYLTDHAGLSAPIGKAAMFTQTPAGGAQISGSETLTEADDAVARFVLDSRSDSSRTATLSVSEHVETEISTRTGLLIRSSRTRATTGPGSASQTVVETRTLTPIAR
jgi:hypothetical protein